MIFGRPACLSGLAEIIQAAVDGISAKLDRDVLLEHQIDAYEFVLARFELDGQEGQVLGVTEFQKALLYF